MSEIKEAEHELEEKRSAKLTAKALAFKMETLQKERKAHVNKIKGLTRDIKELMNKDDNAKAVLLNLEKLNDLYKNAKAVHDAFILLIPKDEQDAHIDWFGRITKCNDDFVEDVAS